MASRHSSPGRVRVVNAAMDITFRHLSPQSQRGWWEPWGFLAKAFCRRSLASTTAISVDTCRTEQNTHKRNATQSERKHSSVQEGRQCRAPEKTYHERANSTTNGASRGAAGRGWARRNARYRRPRIPFGAASDGGSRSRADQASTPRKSGTGSSPSPPSRPRRT